MKRLILMSMCIFSILIAEELKTKLNLSRSDDMEYAKNNLNQYKSQCEAKDGDSCRIVGNYYKEVYIASKYADIESSKTALDWYMKGCNVRHGSSCYAISSMYEHDLYPSHLPKDEAKAFEFQQKGCDYKYALSCGSVGHYYWKLERETSDKSEKKEYIRKAKFFYKKACDLGSKLGCNSYKEM